MGGGGGGGLLKLLLTPLGGSGGMPPPRKFLTFSCSEIASGAISLVESWLAVSLWYVIFLSQRDMILVVIIILSNNHCGLL